MMRIATQATSLPTLYGLRSSIWGPQFTSLYISLTIRWIRLYSPSHGGCGFISWDMSHKAGGDTTPSAEDIETIRQLSAVGKLLDSAVRDHLRIGDRWIRRRAHGWG